LIEINTTVKRAIRLVARQVRLTATYDMRYKLQSPDQLRACLGRVPDDIRVEVERGLAVSAETVADLRLLSDLPPGLILVINSELDPRFNFIRVERP
jgi:hypothetical protein